MLEVPSILGRRGTLCLNELILNTKYTKVTQWYTKDMKDSPLHVRYQNQIWKMQITFCSTAEGLNTPGGLLLPDKTER